MEGVVINKCLDWDILHDEFMDACVRRILEDVLVKRKAACVLPKIDIDYHGCSI